MHPAARPVYSYRSDASVPSFDDQRPIAFMDGSCALCCWGARLIDRLDRSGEIRICPVQTPLGRSVMRHYGLRDDDPETWLLLEHGRALGGFDAVARIGHRSGGWGHLLRLLRLLPAALRDWLYGRVASGRYRLFGRAELCQLPDPGLRARLLPSVES